MDKLETSKLNLLQFPKTILGGALMGLANLVPGASGGTILLATGLYVRFIQALGNLSSFRFKVRDFIFLGVLSLAAIGTVLIAAKPIKLAILEQTMPMYSVFLGFTLGGLPLIWSEVKPASSTFFISLLIAFVLSTSLILGLPFSPPVTSGPYLLFLAGLVGAAAMVLPGLSGGYLVLLLGQYLPILSAIGEIGEVFMTPDSHVIERLIAPCLTLLPVGIGVLIGIVAVSRLLKFTLAKNPQASFGVLAGLVLGATVKLWPFQRVIEANNTALTFRHYFPEGFEIFIAVLLALGAFCLPLSISFLDKKNQTDT